VGNDLISGSAVRCCCWRSPARCWRSSGRARGSRCMMSTGDRAGHIRIS
jgi:hypothetical protein